MYKRALNTYYKTVYQMALAIKGLIGDLEDDEIEAAKNKELSDEQRRKASRRASLLKETYCAAFTVAEAIADIKNDDGVDDLEEYWELEDNELNKDAAENA